MNFHKIKAVISNEKKYKEYFQGIAEYIHGMISNRIKFKNSTIRPIIYLNAKIKNAKINIKNSCTDIRLFVNVIAGNDAV